jgi:hypothetical protein
LSNDHIVVVPIESRKDAILAAVHCRCSDFVFDEGAFSEAIALSEHLHLLGPH